MDRQSIYAGDEGFELFKKHYLDPNTQIKVEEFEFLDRDDKRRLVDFIDSVRRLRSQCQVA